MSTEKCAESPNTIRTQPKGNQERFRKWRRGLKIIPISTNSTHTGTAMYPQVLKMRMCASVSVDGSRSGPLLDQSETTEPFQVSQCWVLNYWSGLPNPAIRSAAPRFSGSTPTHNYRLKSSRRCFCPQQNTNSFKSVPEITVTFQDSVQLLSHV